eukprot:jgi/Astpho2/809/gw1.00016.332.1_t
MGITPGEDLMSAMASQTMQRLQHFNSQNISNTLWAMASLNYHPGPMLLKVLQRELLAKLRLFTPQGVENVLHAMMSLDSSSPQNLSNLVWSLATMQSTLSEFTAQALTNLFWAFAAIGDDPGGASARHFPALPSADLLEMLRMLYQALMLQRMWGGSEAACTLPPDLEAMAKQAWQASVPTSRAIGQIQKEVSQVLGQLLVPQRVGQLTEDGLFLLDICVAGQRVALELDGPEHYLRN